MPQLNLGVGDIIQRRFNIITSKLGSLANDERKDRQVPTWSREEHRETFPSGSGSMAHLELWLTHALRPADYPHARVGVNTTGKEYLRNLKDFGPVINYRGYHTHTTTHTHAHAHTHIHPPFGREPIRTYEKKAREHRAQTSFRA